MINLEISILYKKGFFGYRENLQHQNWLIVSVFNDNGKKRLIYTQQKIKGQVYKISTKLNFKPLHKEIE